METFYITPARIRTVSKDGIDAITVIVNHHVPSEVSVISSFDFPTRTTPATPSAIVTSARSLQTLARFPSADNVADNTNLHTSAHAAVNPFDDLDHPSIAYIEDGVVLLSPPSSVTYSLYSAPMSRAMSCCLKGILVFLWNFGNVWSTSVSTGVRIGVREAVVGSSLGLSPQSSPAAKAIQPMIHVHRFMCLPSLVLDFNPLALIVNIRCQRSDFQALVLVSAFVPPSSMNTCIPVLDQSSSAMSASITDSATVRNSVSSSLSFKLPASYVSSAPAVVSVNPATKTPNVSHNSTPTSSHAHKAIEYVRLFRRLYPTLLFPSNVNFSLSRDHGGASPKPTLQQSEEYATLPVISSLQRSTEGRADSSQVASFAAPSAETVQAVNQWLSSFNVTSTRATPAGDWIKLSIPVKTANQLLNTHFSMFNHTESRQVSVRTLEYFRERSPITAISAARFTPEFEKRATVNCNATITPACLQTLYGIPTTPMSSSTQSSIGVAAFSGQKRPDLPSTMTFTTELFDGATNSQTGSRAGVEAVSSNFPSNPSKT
ncbi:hypothetical protein FB446DRAFT_840803 [Lentinula raphanica]|nr:hypothetical protein FB446DRAFT_840803 [Lentinula raphanica]